MSLNGTRTPHSFLAGFTSPINIELFRGIPVPGGDTHVFQEGTLFPRPAACTGRSSADAGPVRMQEWRPASQRDVDVPATPADAAAAGTDATPVDDCPSAAAATGPPGPGRPPPAAPARTADHDDISAAAAAAHPLSATADADI